MPWGIYETATSVVIIAIDEDNSDKAVAAVQWTCMHCRSNKRWVTEDPVQVAQLREWVTADKESRGHVQDIMPDVPASIRETFISGVCSGCWDRMFPDE